ncbi:MAG: hypothetical protein U5K74_12010 [Gemmatimonadaceae bacterium]|nr:hypothetical protein [Gemmatimonadaceae bacterium]
MQFHRVRRAIQLVTVLLASASVTLPLHAQRSVTTAAAVAPATYAVASRAAAAVADSANAYTRSRSDDLLRVYGDGEWTMLWSQDGIPTVSARAMIDAMRRLDERGIDTATYGVDALQALAGGHIATEAERIAFDTGMTLASIRVLRTLHGGQTAGAQLAPRTRVAPDPVDIHDELLTLTSISTPDLVLDAAEPQYPQYRMLKAALPTYRALAATDSAARGRVAQIEMSLERWRWLPHGDAAAGIIVNIPEFRLYAWRTDSLGHRDTLSMDVVVGDAAAYQTPIFSDSVAISSSRPTGTCRGASCRTSCCRSRAVIPTYCGRTTTKSSMDADGSCRSRQRR